MANLRDRLKRIQETKKLEKPQTKQTTAQTQNDDLPNLTNNGWMFCGYKVLKREVKKVSPFKSIKSLPDVLAILVPDLKKRQMPALEDFLFFDLETTGLSSGAGTVAFLAAFGKIVSNSLYITQYLLLDYPGENDFLENVINEFKNEKVVVSFNGKCFDSQIIKTRCLMNRFKPPLYWHVDLLHPARRLWKSIIQDCSQGSIEAKILGIDRSEDIPGALAPEIWFEFLKTGNSERLIGICDHNISDIAGLTSILNSMIVITSSPFKVGKYNYDLERLARSVYAYAYEQMKLNNYEKPLELITDALNILESDTFWYGKLERRKKRLIKKMN